MKIYLHVIESIHNIYLTFITIMRHKKSNLLITLLLLFISSIGINAQNAITLGEIEQFLKEEGYVPQVLSDIELKFKREGKWYFISAPKNKSYTAIRPSAIYYGDYDEDPELVSEAMLRINSMYYGIQYYREDSKRYIQAMVPLIYLNIAHFKSLFNKNMEHLEMCEKSFVNERKKLNQKGYFFTNCYWDSYNENKEATNLEAGKFQEIAADVRIYSSKEQVITLTINAKGPDALLDIQNSTINLKLQQGNHKYSIIAMKKNKQDWKSGVYKCQLAADGDIIDEVELTIR